MATKKNSPKKGTAKQEQSTMHKIAETIGQVAGEISVKKDQFTEMASNAIDAIKLKIHDVTSPKVKIAKKVAKAAPKKAVKPAVKKAVAKTVKQATKKSAPLKKAAKKVNGKK